jgi:YVTN family beta-propeller protein
MLECMFREGLVKVSLALGFVLAIALQAGPPLTQLQTIPLGSINGRIDHLAVDVKGQRLFVAALGNNTVEVIDLKTGAKIHTIPGLKAPQGVLYHPDTNRLVVACRDDGSIRIFDASSWKLLQNINKFGDADNLRYDPETKHILAGYGDGAIGIFDANGKQLGEVKLETHPESFQVERRGPRVFVNTPGSSNIVIVDRVTKSIERAWPLPSAAANYAMAMNEAGERLFVVTRKPPKLFVLNLRTGLSVDDRRTVGDVDDVFYDAARRRIYIIGGEGSVDVVHEISRDRFEPLATIPTAPGARTGLFVPELNRLYVAVPHRDKQPAEIRVFEAAN